MKKTLLILLLFSFGKLLFSQGISDFTAMKLKNINEDKDKIKASAIKSIAKILYEPSLSGKFEQKSKYIWEYDNNGYIIAEIHPVSELFTGRYIHNYYYDSTGQVIFVDMQSASEDNSGWNYNSVYYKYDNLGRLIEANYYDRKKNEKYMIERYKYDESSNIIEEYSYLSGSGELVSRMEYDNSGNVTLKRMYKLLNGVEDSILKVQYSNKYNEEMKLIEIIEKIGISDHPNTYNYEYDAEDRLSRLVTNNLFEGKLIKEFYYDKNGLLLSEVTLNSNGKIIKKTEYIFEYFDK